MRMEGKNVPKENGFADRIDDIFNHDEGLRLTLVEVLDGILAELNCGGLIPHARVMNALRLMCEAVKPQFQ